MALSLSEIEHRIITIENKGEPSAPPDLSAITSRISNIESNIKSIEGINKRVDSVGSTMSVLQQHIVASESIVAHLEPTLDSATDAIDTLREALRVLAARVEALETKE